MRASDRWTWIAVALLLLCLALLCFVAKYF